MIGLNNIRGAYEQVYVQLNESLVRDRARNVVADDRLDAEQKNTNASMNKLRAQTKRHSKSTALDRARAQIAAKKSEDTARSMHPKPRTSGYRIEEFDQLDERMSDDEKEMRRLAAQERRAGKSDRLDSKVGAKYAESEKKSAEREDKKSKGKHIHGMADSVEVDGDLVDEGMTMKDFKKKRSALKQKEKRAADKLGRSRRAGIHDDKASPERAARHRANVDPDYDRDDEEQMYPGGKLKNPKKIRKAKAMGELGESAVPGKPAERLGAVTGIPKSEQEAARERILAKTAAKRKEREQQKEEAELEEGKRGLWDNIHAKRKRGERPAKPGEKGYPKTLNVEEVDQIIEGIKQARKNVGASKCWSGKKLGNPPTKMKGGKEVPNCVPEELELDERALDTAETGEKERLVKGMKKSAADFKKRYGERAKSVMYATATKMAKKHMDTSKSDRRYGVEEETSMEENADLENRKVGPRKPSQIAKREKLNKLIDEIRSKKESESK